MGKIGAFLPHEIQQTPRDSRCKSDILRCTWPGQEFAANISILVSTGERAPLPACMFTHEEARSPRWKFQFAISILTRKREGSDAARLGARSIVAHHQGPFNFMQIAGHCCKRRTDTAARCLPPDNGCHRSGLLVIKMLTPAEGRRDIPDIADFSRPENPAARSRQFLSPSAAVFFFFSSYETQTNRFPFPSTKWTVSTCTIRPPCSRLANILLHPTISAGGWEKGIGLISISTISPSSERKELLGPEEFRYARVAINTDLFYANYRLQARNWLPPFGPRINALPTAVIKALIAWRGSAKKKHLEEQGNREAGERERIITARNKGEKLEF